MTQPPRPAPNRLPLLLLVATFVLVSGWLAVTLNFWRDESYTSWIVAGDLATTLERAVGHSHSLPFYFLVLHAWSLAWDSPVLDRLLSIVLVAGAIVAAWPLSRRLLPALHPIVLPLLVATQPLALWAATELRFYPLTLLLSTLLLLAYQTAYWTDGGAGRQRLLFVLLAVASLYTQHYLGYLLAGLGVGLVVAGRFRAALRYGADMAVVAVLCAPLGWILAGQVGVRLQDLEPRPPLIDQVRFVVERVESFAVPLTTAAIEGGLSEEGLRWAMRGLRATVLAALAALVVSLRGRWRMLLSPPLRAWLAALVVYAGFLVLSISMVGIALVSPRHTISLVVPVLATTLLVFAGSPRRGLVYGMAGLMLAGNLATTGLRFAPLAKECDCARAAAWIESREGPGEPILVFNAEDVMPMRHHYRGRNRLVPIPRDPIEGFEHWDPRKLTLQNADEVERALASIESEPERLWVFRGATLEVYGFSFGGEHLESYLARGWREVERREFHRGVLVRRFERMDRQTGPEGDRGDTRSGRADT